MKKIRKLLNYKYDAKQEWGAGWGYYWINPLLIEQLFEEQDTRFNQFLEELKQIKPDSKNYSLPMIEINKLIDKFY